MPLYEYRCDKCGSVFEVIQRFSDEPLSVHENCGGALERLISTSALQFKGSGWYVTDYARSGSDGRKKSGDEKSAKPVEAAAKSEKKDTKPAETSTSAKSDKNS
jgi:putative FmdB family regulatory protein